MADSPAEPVRAAVDDASLDDGSVATARGEASERIPLPTLLVYSAPSAGIGFMFLLTSTYLMKFSTDVLGIAPAAMGTIFFVSRVWDAVSDPMAGFLSDRTHTRLGRRRPWLLVGALPLGFAFVGMWAPPSLSPTLTTLWMGVFVVLTYTSLTVFLMPHDALGAELSPDYHERNRVFGVKRAAFGCGAILVFVALARLTASDDPRGDARMIAIASAAVTAALMLWAGSVLRERPEFLHRGARNPFRAAADVFRNPHARLLLAVFCIQQLGLGALTFAAAYHAEYVLGRPELLSAILGVFFAVSVVSIPVWVWLGKRYEKKPLIVAHMWMAGAAIGAMFFVGEGDVAFFLAMAAVGGFSSGCGDVIFPSLQADVIDWDEHRTGQRKEGVYFAAWNFAAKTAVGVSAVVTGSALAQSGFEPNQEQSESARMAIRALISLFPFVCYGAGALLFLRFRLSEEAHAEIRRALDRRARPDG